MSRRTQVGLLFGGRSVEHEVSVTSARSARDALAETSFDVIPLAVTVSGEWLSPEVSKSILNGTAPRVQPTADEDDRVRLAAQPGAGLLRIAADGAATRLALDVIFPLVHGWGGEDGRLQGTLDLAGIPYVGAGVLGSAMAMSKAACRTQLEAAGIAVCPWLSFSREDFRSDSQICIDRIEELGYPVFVKPSNGGSSVGISRVTSIAGLAPAVELALEHDRVVVVEQGLDAREIECAVLGNDTLEASGLGEIVPAGEFYDYDAKYIDDTSELLIPAELPAETTDEVRRLAVDAMKALDVRGFARVDFLVERKTGKIFLNEINTLPGFTPISMFPKLWEVAGVAYPALIERLVNLGLDGEE